MLKSIALAAVLVITLTVNAFALDLGAAKGQGLVGERPDGYLGAVAAGRADVQALVNDINAQRRTKYQGIAERRGTTLAAVEQFVGQKLISRAGPGEYVMTPGGQWVRK
ncbi:MAG: YdbL family protein [Rhodospirillales bacterium]